jgi:hypothetical protein
MGSVDDFVRDEYAALEDNPENLDKIVTNDITVEGNTYTISTKVEESYIQRYLLG